MVVKFTDEQIPFVHVGHYGEAIAAEYFSVDPNIGGALGAGHDFVTRDGQRVEVKTLKSSSTGRRRTVIVNSGSRKRGEANMLRHGEKVYGYDLLFALRMDDKLRPTEALIIPRRVIVARQGTVSWTLALPAHPDVTHLTWDDRAEAFIETR